MPHSISAKKRVRQNEKRRQKNLSLKRKVRTLVKRTEELIAEGDLEEAREVFDLTQKALDKAAGNNIFHDNKVARKKSQLARALHEAETKS